MKASKLMIIGVVAGLTIALLNLADRVAPPEAATAPSPAAVSLANLDTANGLLPINQAIDLWQERSDGQPLDYLSRTQLGVAQSAQAKEAANLAGYENAEATLREALELNPRYQPAQLALASALTSQHQFAEALSIAQQVYQTDNTSLSALALSGDANLELGDYLEARADYQVLAQTERSAPIVSRLARLAFITGDSDGAVELADEALGLSGQLALRPNGAAFYWYQRGHFRFVAGDIPGAVQDLEQALEISPSHPAASEELAFVLAATGDVDRAIEQYERLISQGSAADLHGLYADMLRSAGDFAAADEQERLGLELADATIDRFPAERRHLAGFFMTRDPEIALDLAEADLAERADIGAYDTYAWALFHNGRYAEAYPAIQSALSEGTRDAALLYHAAAIADRLGDTSAARSYLSEALEINPSFHPTEAADAAALADAILR